MTRVRLSGRQKAVLAVALGLLMWAPTGISHTDHTAIVTGHSSFYNGEGYDPCLASLAGIIRSRVMWFNDQVLVERYAGKGTFIYVTEYGAPDPRARTALYTEGIYYDFTDPNGAQWHVEEAWYAEAYSPGASTGATVPDPMALGEWEGADGGVSTEYNVTTVKPENKYHVWFVELSANPIYDEFAGADPHTYYNFLSLIDTCKFNKERLDEVQDENDDPNAYYGTELHDFQSGELNADNGHPTGETEHTHEKWIVDLWIGRRPETIPFGEVSTNPSSWQSGWAGYAAEETNESAQQSVPDGFEESLP